MDQVIFRDGLGERRRLTSLSQTGQLDVLCLDWELTSVPSFEPALRARVARLATFRHPSFADVRGVQRVGEPPACTLAIASDATPGVRLSELLAAGDRKIAALDISVAVFLIRQLVVAIAALHDDGEELAHGAIALERLVLTSDARLVVVEPMLGPALEELKFSHARLWHDLRVATLRTNVQPVLDQRADVMQLGLVALSLILARPITNDEYPTHIQELVATAWAVSAHGNLEPVPAGLRAWLGRALQLDIRNSFSTAIEAKADLNKMFGAESATGAPGALKAFLSKLQPAGSDTSRPEIRSTPFEIAAKLGHVSSETPRPEPLPAEPRSADPRTAPRSIVADADPSPTPKPLPAPTPSAPLSSVTVPDQPRPLSVIPIAAAVAPTPGPAAPILETTRPAAGLLDTAPAPRPRVAMPSVPTVSPVNPSIETGSVAEKKPAAPVARIRVHHSAKWLTPVAVGILILVVSGGVVTARRHLMPAPTLPAAGRLAINTNPDGATVIVDGEPRGVTPVSLTVAAGAHAIELHGQGEPRRMSITVEAGSEVSQYIELPRSAPTLGGLQVRSDPTGAHVTVDGIPRGVSPATITGLAPGDHVVVVESEAGSTRQTVVVEPGMTAALTAQLSNQGAPASGWISVSAPQEVQVFENGRLVGSSQSDKVMVLAGTHQLDLVNQAIGYRSTKTVLVTAGKTSTIKVEFPNGTLALNATPWADVWIDGSRVGETPIGNLPVAIGTHEIVFRHPDLGEQVHVATVTLNAPTRLSVDMRKK